MNKKLLNISDKITPDIFTVLEPIAKIIADNHLDCFVVGATARDIIFNYCYDIRVRQATHDIDWGIRVSSWNEYKKLKSLLTETGVFFESTNQHRLTHKSKIPIDLIPFGEIAKKDKISWPPKHETEMNVMGYLEAYQNAVEIIIKNKPKISLKFASATGIALLKIISWADNPELRRKDAEDLLYIIKWYLDLDNYDRLVDEHEDILEVDNFETINASARLLGRDIAKIISSTTKQYILTILEEELIKEDNSKLILHLLLSENDSYESIRSILENIKDGVLD
jgi:predicted nucleotidyltransferase